MQLQNAIEIADIQLDNRLRSKPQRGPQTSFEVGAHAVGLLFF
jgi:hypothetical protein